MPFIESSSSCRCQMRQSHADGACTNPTSGPGYPSSLLCTRLRHYSSRNHFRRFALLTVPRLSVVGSRATPRSTHHSARRTFVSCVSNLMASELFGGSDRSSPMGSTWAVRRSRSSTANCFFSFNPDGIVQRAPDQHPALPHGPRAALLQSRQWLKRCSAGTLPFA